jgi:hypothetical protein
MKHLNLFRKYLFLNNRKLYCDGGTEILGSIKYVFENYKSEKDKMLQLILITDGGKLKQFYIRN